MSNEDPQGVSAAKLAIEAALRRAEAAASAAEEWSQKANSEANYAFNAKNVCEDHQKAIASIKGNVDAELGWFTTAKTNADQMQSALAGTRATAEADARTVAEQKETALREAEAARKFSADAKSQQGNVLKMHEAVTTANAKVIEDAASVTQAKATVEQILAAITALQTQATDLLGQATIDGKAITKLEVDARKSASEIEKIAAETVDLHNRVTDYEKELTRLTKLCADLHDKIEGLLPNATSAGLASAFRSQQARFAIPQRNWLITFVAAIAGLFVIGVSFIGSQGIWPFVPVATPIAPESWDAILRHFAGRLPVVIPLVWLAIYAGRHYTVSLRMQEEYAFKEALSTSFEGYKREMANIAERSTDGLSPLGALCLNVLETLGQRPGRIYEGKHEDVTPAGTAADGLSRFMPWFRQASSGPKTSEGRGAGTTP